MTKEFETQKASLIEIVNGLEDGDKYIVTVLRPLDDTKTAGTVAICGGIKDVFMGIGEIVKSILKQDQAPADQCLALSRDLSRFIAEACAEASAEMLAEKSPDEAISEIQALLNLMVGSDDEDESDADSDHANE